MCHLGHIFIFNDCGRIEGRMKGRLVSVALLIVFALLTEACSLQQRKVGSSFGAPGLYPTPTASPDPTPTLSPTSPALRVRVYPEGAYGRMQPESYFDPDIPGRFSRPGCAEFPVSSQPFQNLYCYHANPDRLDSCGYSGTETMSADAWSRFEEGKIIDWALVELRNSLDPTTLVARRAGFLMSDGLILDTDYTSPLSFSGLPSGSYRVLVRVRGHLAVVSKDPISLQDERTTDLNLTDPDQLAGDSEENFKGTSGIINIAQMIAGDFSSSNVGFSDGVIDSSDTGYLNSPQISCGYSPADLNFDGMVNSDDQAIYSVNLDITHYSFERDL